MKIMHCLVLIAALACISGAKIRPEPQVQPDFKISTADHGFQLVTTAKYTIEIPKGWTVTQEDESGRRDFIGEIQKDGSQAEISATSATSVEGDWGRLYATTCLALKDQYGDDTVITPYKLSRTKQRYYAITFDVLTNDKTTKYHEEIVKRKDGSMVTLSVKLPDKKDTKEIINAFWKMADTVTFSQA